MTMNASPARARLVLVAGLAFLAMAALRCGTKPVAEAAHAPTGDHEGERVSAGEQRKDSRNDDASNGDPGMDAVLRVCHTAHSNGSDLWNLCINCGSCQAAEVINWNYFPRSSACPSVLRAVIEIFQEVENVIDSKTHVKQESNKVLAVVEPGLLNLGFRVESGKKASQKISIPVLFGQNGKIEKSFDADAWHEEFGVVVEVEAGRAFDNNQFLKDIFQASAMNGVDYCVVAVRNLYRGRDDFSHISTFVDTLYASERLSLPLKGILILGY